MNGILSLVKEWCIGYGMELLKAVIILILGLWAINKVCKFCTIFLSQTNLEIGLVAFFNSFLKIVLRFTLILLVLPIFGINITSIITAVGASVVTLGVVLKDSISNFASGIMIIINKPIRVGDYIEFENVKGTVTKIQSTFTTLRASNESSVIIPNSRLLSNNIIRNSPYDVCECKFCYTIQSKNPNQDISKILSFVLASNDKILQLPPPDIKYTKTDLGETRADITLFCEKRYSKNLDEGLLESLSASLKNTI